jgi:ribosomal protein L16 Arg81 hydroxylase
MPQVKPVECVTEPGEVLFVPRGWWHAALNLEPCIALTQNFVSAANLRPVLRFLGTRRSDLVSGCKEEDRATLYERFVDALRATRPEVRLH